MKPLKQILHELLDHQKALDYSPHTIESTRSNSTFFLIWLADKHGVIHAETLRADHLHDYQKHLSTYVTHRGTPLKPSALNTKVKGLRRLLQFTYERNYVTRRLTHDIHYVREPQLLPTSVLTHKQVKKLIKKIDPSSLEGMRDRAAIELLYSTGIRIGELSTLKTGDVDLDVAAMKVFGKGRKERMVPIGKTALRHLTSYVRGVRQFLAARCDQDYGEVFLNDRGRPLLGHNLRQSIHEYAKTAGIEINVTPHTFRRSCASEMVKGNANLYHVKELLGHSSLNTLKHYTKLHITDLQKTHAKCHPREKDSP